MTDDQLKQNSILFGIMCNFHQFCGEERAKEAKDYVANAFAEVKRLEAENKRLQKELEAANKRNTFIECEVADGQAFCPACGEEVVGYYSDYCEHCGQALSLPPEE